MDVLEQHRQRGNAAFKARDFDAAISAYSDALAAFRALPNDEQRCVAVVDEVSKSLGNWLMCLHKTGAFSACVEAAREALAINPFLAKAHGFLAMALLDRSCDDVLISNAAADDLYGAHMALARSLSLLPEMEAALQTHLTRARQLLVRLRALPPRAGVATAAPVAESQLSDKCGRGIFASRDVHPGEVVASLTSPFSVALYDKQLSTSLCFQCGLVQPERQFIVCPHCKSAAYCSETCAAKYAARHTLECAKFVKLDEIIAATTSREIDLPEDFQEIAAHVITTISGIRTDRDGSMFVTELEGHDDAVVQALTPMAPLLWELFGEEPQPFVSHIIGVVRSNAIQLADAGGFAAGEGLFASSASLFNHSCAPNCFVDVAARCIRTTRAISSGTELRISYIPNLFWPQRHRADALAQRFFFTCRCKRCQTTDSFEETVTTAMLPGARSDASSFFHPLVQNLCASVRSRHVEDIDEGAERELLELHGRAARELHPLHYLLHDLRNTLCFVRSVLHRPAAVFGHCTAELALWECLLPGSLAVKADKIRCALLCCEAPTTACGAAPNSESVAKLIQPQGAEFELAGAYFAKHLPEYSAAYAAGMSDAEEGIDGVQAS